MQIDGGVFQVRMAEKQLNGSQIGTGFQVVRGKTVPQRVRSDFFLDTGTNGGPFADVPNRLVGDGLFLSAMAGAGKQKILRFPLAPVLTQGLQQRGTQGHLAVTGAFALANVQDHALAIDVTHFKQRGFGPANAGPVEHHEHGAMQGIGRRFDQTSYFFLAQHHRQFLRSFGINQVIEGQIVSLYNLLVEKTQRRHVYLDAACCALLFVEPVELVSAYLLGAKFSWRLAKILGELLDSMDITASSLWGIVATLDFLQHSLT